jgi:hypothetical protein
MKHLRKYIRQLLLEGTINAKIDGQIAKLDSLKDYWITSYQITKFDKFKVVQLRITDMDGQNELGEWQGKWSGYGSTGHCNGALIISGSGNKVQKNLGPLLYDLGMEMSYIVGADGIGPDAREVSDEAKTVWDYYLNNRPDVQAKQRDFLENPQNDDESDDCLGQDTAADRFPGGREKAYTKFTHHNPVGFDDPEEGWDTAEEYSQEFIDYYFDPKYSLSKTYHKDVVGYPILTKLKSLFLLSPSLAREAGMDYSDAEIEQMKERHPNVKINK